MQLLNRYIRLQVISATVLIIGIILGIESFLEFVSQLPDIGVAKYGLLKAMIVVPMLLPSEFYQLFPMAGFLGSLIGLGRLSTTSELISMRAAGVSIHQIAVSVIKAALIMLVVVTFIGEWLAPKWQHQSAVIKQNAMGRIFGMPTLNGVWMRHDNSIINISVVTSAAEIGSATIFDFDGRHRLSGLSVSERGALKDKKWRIENIVGSKLSEKQVEAVKKPEGTLSLGFNPKLIYQTQQNVNEEPIWDLFRSILYRRHMGLLTSQYEFAFWQRLVQPLTTVIMICLGIPFVFGSLRQAGMGHRLLLGVIIGFLFYMLNQFLGPFTLVYQFPPFLAAISPSILFLITYLVLIRRMI